MITITHGVIAGWLVGFVVAFIALSIYDGKLHPSKAGGFGNVLGLAMFWPVALALVVVVGIIIAPLSALNWCYEKISGRR